MDPLSIAASCLGITAGIVTLAERLTAFVSSVREARKDLDAVRRELGSLQLSLSALSNEDASFSFDKTPSLKENLLGVLRNCGGIVDEISTLLKGMEGDGDGKMAMRRKLKWATMGKGEMLKLRVGLEAHKSALDIALDLIAISITADIKQDTSDLKEDTSKIKEDTDQILQEIGNLRVQVAQMEVTHDRGYIMKRFLESSVTYAESVANTQDSDEDIDNFEQPPEVPRKVPENQYSQKRNVHRQPPFLPDRRPQSVLFRRTTKSPPSPLSSPLSSTRRPPFLPNQLSRTVRPNITSPKVPENQYSHKENFHRKHKDLLFAEVTLLDPPTPIWRTWTRRVGAVKYNAKFLHAIRRTGREALLVELQMSETLTRGFPIDWFCIDDLQYIERKSGFDLADDIAKAKTEIVDAFGYRLVQLKLRHELSPAHENRTAPEPSTSV